jgi:hypothetical protein
LIDFQTGENKGLLNKMPCIKMQGIKQQHPNINKKQKLFKTAKSN